MVGDWLCLPSQCRPLCDCLIPKCASIVYMQKSGLLSNQLQTLLEWASLKCLLWPGFGFQYPTLVCRRRCWSKLDANNVLLNPTTCSSRWLIIILVDFQVPVLHKLITSSNSDQSWPFDLGGLWVTLQLLLYIHCMHGIGDWQYISLDLDQSFLKFPKF